MYRRLAQDRPAAFQPDLARSLSNLADHVSGLGLREEALAASQEAVSLYRQVAHHRPAAFLPDLAGSLVNHATCLSGLGLREEAWPLARKPSACTGS